MGGIEWEAVEPMIDLFGVRDEDVELFLVYLIALRDRPTRPS